MKDSSALTSGTSPAVEKKKKKQKEVSVSIKGILRSQKGTKKGVYVRVIINKEQDYFPTTYYVEPKDFDKVSGFVKSKHPDSETINSEVRQLSKELDDIIYGLKRKKEAVTIESFKKAYVSRFKQQLSFEEYFKLAIEEKKGTVTESTLEVYNRLPKKILEHKPNVTLGEINKKFIQDWEKWLLQEKGICQNTANHYLETLRTFLIKAVEDGVIEKNPFESIKIKQIIGERDYLTEEEVRALIKVEIPELNTGEKRAREMFVFCCLTGIRYSDLVNLKWSHIRPLTGDMHFKMLKTQVWVTIPLVDAAKEILERQDKSREFVFQRISNQKLNDRLHALEKRAEIPKNITVHVARHTFATLALERGVSLEAVSKILGHKNLKTTMVYARITEKKLKQEMEKLNGLVQAMSSAKEQPVQVDIINLYTRMQEMMARMEQLAAAIGGQKIAA